jgi:TonB-linked SusC/RagA family outer membrane protein
VPQEIESVSILKDGASTSLYGMQGAGGAIVITTKRGFSGKSKIDVYAGYAVQQMTKRPSLLGSNEYIALRNQAALNDGQTQPYPQNVVNGFASGNTDLYPDNDWYNMYFRQLSTMQRAGVSIAGGTGSVKFFTNLNYRHQSSLFNIDEVEGRQYDPTPGGHSLNFRSNVDVSFSSRITGFLRISGNVELEKYAGVLSNQGQYSNLFQFPPTMYGPTTPADNEFPSQVVTTSEAVYDSPYAALNRSGYRENLTTNIMSQAGLKLDMDFIAKGLSLSGSMAYQTRASQSTTNTQSFAMYIRNTSSYDVLEFTQLGTTENTPLKYPPNKTADLEYNLNLYATLDYEQRSGDHYLKAMAYGMYLQQEVPQVFYMTWGSNRITTSNVLPYYRQNFGGSLLYGYADRYFAKVDLGYTGSEQFAKGNRYVLTPAFSAAWIASDEEFLKGNSLVTYLKLRASVGVNANDQLGSTRFMYLDYYDAAGNEGLKGNPDLKPETITKQNYGFDLGLAELLTLHFDYYYHRTDNMLISGAGMSPTLSGIALGNFPKFNKGAMENSGFEAEAIFSKEVARDLHLTAGFGLGFNRNKVLNANEAPQGEGYAYQYRTEGYPLGQLWALKVDYSNGNGYINTQEELDAARIKYKLGIQPRLGDLMYQDISGDGAIDEKDAAPVGNPTLPQVNYNVNLALSYKGLEVNLLLQGTARSSSYLLMTEYQYPGLYFDVHRNAWTAERYASGAEITYPALSYSTASVSSSHRSDYNIYDASYLRLRNLEVAYTLPVRFSGFISAQAIRVAFNAQNLFTLDHTPSKYLDPEVREFTSMSPFRVYNITLGVKF